MTDPDPGPLEYREIQRPDLRWWLPWAPLAEYRRQVKALWREVLNLKENLLMASDRDLLAVIASGLASVIPAVDALSADRDSWKSRALAAEGAAATDEAEDTAAAQPIKDALDALASKLAPVAPAEPAPPIEDVPGTVSDAPEPSDDGGDVPNDAA